MPTRQSMRIIKTIHLAVAAIIVAGAIILGGLPSVATTASVHASQTKGPFQFEPLLTSAACTAGGDGSQPFLLPDGFVQNIIASEPQFPDLPDMHTLNENGPQAGRFLYRTHEVGSNGAVSVTDLFTGSIRKMASAKPRVNVELRIGSCFLRRNPFGTKLVLHCENVDSDRSGRFRRSKQL